MSEPVSPSRLLGDVARLLATSVGEVVPPGAQLHLLNAQRELLLGVAAIIEHNSGRTPGRPRGGVSGGKAPGRRPRRVELD